MDWQFIPQERGSICQCPVFLIFFPAGGVTNSLLSSKSCVWREVSSHHPQEVLLAQFSLYVHIQHGGLYTAINSDRYAGAMFLTTYICAHIIYIIFLKKDIINKYVHIYMHTYTHA